MRRLAATITLALLAGSVGGSAHAQVAPKQKSQEGRQSRSPSAIAERQRHKKTFDETRYYERLSEKIPFGTPAWWRQREIESTNE